MTTAEIEQYVRSKWDHVNWGASNYELTQFGVILYDDEYGTAFRKSSQAAAWQAAYDFTLAREEEIRQVEEEIEWLLSLRCVEEFSEAPRRILAERKTVLDNLKQGMK